VLITTTDLKQKYEILGIVSHFHSGLETRMIFKKDLTNDELVQEIIQKIIVKAYKLGADAVIDLKIDISLSSNTATNFFIFNIYGTAIRFSK